MSLSFSLENNRSEFWITKSHTINFGEVSLNEMVQKQILIKNRENFELNIEVTFDSLNKKEIYLKDEIHLNVSMHAIQPGEQRQTITIEVNNSRKDKYFILCIVQGINQVDNSQLKDINNNIQLDQIDFGTNEARRRANYFTRVRRADPRQYQVGLKTKLKKLRFDELLVSSLSRQTPISLVNSLKQLRI